MLWNLVDLVGRGVLTHLFISNYNYITVNLTDGIFFFFFLLWSLYLEGMETCGFLLLVKQTSLFFNDAVGSDSQVSLFVPTVTLWLLLSLPLVQSPLQPRLCGTHPPNDLQWHRTDWLFSPHQTTSVKQHCLNNGFFSIPTLSVSSPGGDLSECS